MSNIGQVIKEQRLMSGLTLRQLSDKSGVSSSHLARIERGERFASARILRKMAKALDFDERELFIRAGYLSPEDSASESKLLRGLDPYVGTVLASEPVEVQRTVIGILGILESIAKVREPEA